MFEKQKKKNVVWQGITRGGAERSDIGEAVGTHIMKDLLGFGVYSMSYGEL